MRDNIHNMNFGTQIKEARKEAGLTQEQLGIRCGWTTGNPQSRIGNYEKDVRSPSAADIAVIARALNKNILYFYEQEAPTQVAEPSASYTTETKLSTEQIELLETVIITVERKFKDTEAKTKAKLIAEMFSNYNKLGLKPEDLKTAEETAAENTN